MDRIEKTIILITILGLSFICGLAVLMIGCQTPGNVLSVDDVERILESEGDTICLDDGFDRICTKTIPGPAGKDGMDGRDGKDGMDGRDGRDGENAATVYITERSIIYQFSYEGKPILVAERQIVEPPVIEQQPEEIIRPPVVAQPERETPPPVVEQPKEETPPPKPETPPETEDVPPEPKPETPPEAEAPPPEPEAPPPVVEEPAEEDTPAEDPPVVVEESDKKMPTEKPRGAHPPRTKYETHHVPSGWIVWIYYPDGYPESPRGFTADTIGFDLEVRDAKGKVIEIPHFVQTDGPNGPAVQFKVNTDSEAIIITAVGLIDSHRATFIMRDGEVVSHDGTDTFQLQPL